MLFNLSVCLRTADTPHGSAQKSKAVWMVIPTRAYMHDGIADIDRGDV